MSQVRLGYASLNDGVYERMIAEVAQRATLTAKESAARIMIRFGAGGAERMSRRLDEDAVIIKCR